MEQKSALAAALVVLGAALVAVPCCTVLFKGCDAGTKDMLEWLPRPWDSGCRQTREALQVHCDINEKSSLEELLEGMGFFGTQESQELSFCHFGTRTWTKMKGSVADVVDSFQHFHHSVSRSLVEPVVRPGRLVQLVTQAIGDGVAKTKDAVAGLTEPFVNIPQQFNQQYGQLWDLYNNLRSAAGPWTGTSAFSGGFLGNSKKGYLVSAWYYITCDPGNLAAKVRHQNPDVAEESQSGRPDGISLEMPGLPGDPEVNSLWRVNSQGYLNNLLSLVAKSSDEWISINDLRETLERFQPGKDGNRQDMGAGSAGHSNADSQESVQDIPLPIHPDESSSKGQVSSPEPNSSSVKNVLIEALVATVTAFTLFIVGTILHRMAAAGKFGLRLPSLANILTSRYKPVKLLHSSDNFNSFLMVSKRTRQKVFVKSPTAEASSSAIARLSNEVYNVKRMKQENIVSFVESVRASARFCLALEYACYGSLEEAVKKPAKPFRFEGKIRVYSQILQAVHWMHKSGWAHLNIRPGTILVFEQWHTVKLSGFSRAVEQQGGLCCDFDLHPMCASPRVITKQAYKPAKADLWALGTLLYFLFTSRSVSNSQEGIHLAGVVARMDHDRRPARGLNLLKMLADLLSFYPENRPPIPVLMDAIDNFA